MAHCVFVWPWIRLLVSSAPPQLPPDGTVERQDFFLRAPQLPPEGTEGVGRFFPSVRSNFRLMFLWGGDFLCRPIPLDGTVGDGLNKKTRAFVEMKISAAGRFSLL